MTVFKLSVRQSIGLIIILVTWACIIAFIQTHPIASIPLRHWIIGHLASSLILSIGFQIFFNSREKSLIFWNLGLHLCLPILGPFFSFVLILSMSLSKRMELLADFHEEDAALATKKSKNKPVENYSDSLQTTQQVEPIVEVIRSDSGTDLKRGAIETLTQIANPQSISLLKECLSDDNSEVRFYASSGLSRIEERLNIAIIQAKKELKEIESPKAKHYEQLAKAYYEFVYLSIQDEASLQYYIKQAITNFEKGHKLEPENYPISKALQRAYTRSGQHELARKLKGEYQETTHEAPMYKAESFFKEKKFADCKKVILSLEHKDWDVVQNVIDLWDTQSPANVKGDLS